jgi:hypothetical protein
MLAVQGLRRNGIFRRGTKEEGNGEVAASYKASKRHKKK